MSVRVQSISVTICHNGNKRHNKELTTNNQERLMPYLLKSEPDKYSYDDLERDGETVWDGIKNAQALNYLASMKKSENLVIYHSNVGKEAVGTAKVVSVDASDPKNPIVRIKPQKRFKRPKSLAEIREAPSFKDSILFRQFRLSVVPLSKEQYEWLTKG
jgi:predicted RNA-binding protein with PUA-like domain